MNCPACHNPNPAGARFCSNCGTPLPASCSNCRAELAEGARFCNNCGQPVQQVAAPAGARPPVQTVTPAPTSPDLLERYIPRELLSRLETARSSRAMEGERRVVTILFCDVSGSTLAASKLDPEEWAGIINGAFEYMIQPIYRYEGTVARLQGDGLLAFFGAPIAHEDDPERAVLAGLEILAAIQPYNEQIHRRWGIDFNLRVGINTGLVVVGEVGSDLRVEYSALGDAINMAARMEQSAAPGTLLVAAPTYKLVAPIFETDVIEGLNVRGRDAPVTAYRIVKRKAQRGSLRGIQGLNAPMIGRREQMDALWAAADELSQGRGQIISVMGEAGLGKSRLVTEFRRALLLDTGAAVQWLEGHTFSYDTATPYAPFIGLMSDFFNLAPGEDDQQHYQCIQDGLEHLFPGKGQETAPFFAALIGLDLRGDAAERVKFLPPPQLHGLIFAQVSALVDRLLTSGPLIIYIDDLHWADPTSIKLLLSLLPKTDYAPLMLIASFRPRRQEPAWEFHEAANRDYSHRYQQLQLTPLDQEQARHLVANLLQIDDLPEKVRLKILEKSEGNPFFVEEVIRSLLDSGLVMRVGDHWQATQEINDINLPDTLAGVITARLDQLGDSARHFLQAAAIIGREFAAEVLAEIVARPAELEESLVELQRREMVREKSRTPQRTFIFKHVLTQDAAYNSILLSRRRELHGRTADILIRRTPEAAAEIARHLLKAHQPIRALPYLVQAGDRAARAYATEEAMVHYRQILDLKSTASDPGLLRRAYEGLGQTLTFANQVSEALAVYQEMLAQAESMDDIPMKISALNKLAGVAALHMGQFQEAGVYLDRADSLSRRYDEKSGIPETALIRCQMCTAQADFENVVLIMDEVIQVGRELGTPAIVAMGLEHTATSLVYLTQFEEAQRQAEQGLQIVREIGDREHEAWLLGFTLPLCHISRGDFDSAWESLTESLEIATKIGAIAPHVLASFLLTKIAEWRGNYEIALKYGQISLDAALPLEAYMAFMLVPILGTLGMVYLEISEQFTDKIAEFHRQALRLLEAPANAMTGGSAWADLGHCAITLGDMKIAQESFSQGLNYPNLFYRLERPRHLAGAALVAMHAGDFEEAVRLAKEGQEFAETAGLRNQLPFSLLVLGRILLSSGAPDASLEVLEQSAALAQELGMRPILWQAHAAAAQALAASGNAPEMERRQAAARDVILEIAGEFETQELRDAYLRSNLAKIQAI